MDEQAKIYTIYFAFEDTVTSIANILNNQEDLPEKLDRDRLFYKFLTQGEKQYSDLHYDSVCEMGQAYDRAQQELARIEIKIESFLGNLKDVNNLSVIIYLWIALELALNFYFSICEEQQNLVYDLDEKLSLGHQKYLLLQSNSGLTHIFPVSMKNLGFANENPTQKPGL